MKTAVHERVIAAHAKSRDQVGCGARDCASLQFRARSKAGYPDTCCRSIRSMTPYAKFRTRQKVGRSARCGLGGPKGDRKHHGASERGEGKGRQTIGVLPMHLPRSPSSRFYVFAKASARRGRGECRGEDDYARLFNTKGSKTNTEVRRSVRLAL